MAYKAGHQRREQLARLLGFDSYRKQLAFQRESPANRELVQRRRSDLETRGLLGKGAGRISETRARNIGSAEARKRVFREPDGRFVRTGRESELRAFFRVGAGHDAHITTCTVSVRTDEGVRDVALWSKGGMSAVTAWASVEGFIAAGEPLAAKTFLVSQIVNSGASSYLPADPDAGDVVLVQMGAEW